VASTTRSKPIYDSSREARVHHRFHPRGKDRWNTKLDTRLIPLLRLTTRGIKTSRHYTLLRLKLAVAFTVNGLGSTGHCVPGSTPRSGQVFLPCANLPPRRPDSYPEGLRGRGTYQ
jgi:hypothetical protein